MSKPLTYGPTIGVRLPLDLYNAVAEMAGPDGPGPWIRDLAAAYRANAATGKYDNQLFIDLTEWFDTYIGPAPDEQPGDPVEGIYGGFCAPS